MKMRKNSEPKNLTFLMNLVNSYSDSFQLNKFEVFKSFQNILYLIYGDYSIISYDINSNKRINEIKKPHNRCISGIHYYKDNIKKLELLISYDSNKFKIMEH